MQNWPLIPSNAIHQHKTHRTDNIHMFRCRHTFAQETLRFSIVHTVNDAPQNVFNKFNTHSVHGFSYYVKSILLETYVDRCTIQHCFICSENWSQPHVTKTHVYINTVYSFNWKHACVNVVYRCHSLPYYVLFCFYADCDSLPKCLYCHVVSNHYTFDTM